MDNLHAALPGDRRSRLICVRLEIIDAQGTPGVSLVDTAENLDKGRLARAVAADQRVDFSRTYVEIHLVQGTCPRKGLRQLRDLNPAPRARVREL